MLRFTYARDLDTLTKGSEIFLILAPAPFYDRLPRLFRGRLAELLQKLTRDLRPGDLGNLASTLSLEAKLPRQIAAAALPEAVSRYNAPARPESIQRMVQAAGLSKKSKSAILLVLDHENHLIPALNAVGRAFPLFDRSSGAGSENEVRIMAITPRGRVITVSEPAKETMRVAREVARMVDTPPSEMHPAALELEARALIGEHPALTVTSLEGEALAKAGLGGLYAVGKAAEHPPRLVVFNYRPNKSKGGSIALVGKGITFDTGGLHLKGRGMMEGMKADMGGAGATLGAFRVLLAEEVKQNLSLVLCLAENAIGGAAYKPDDILTLHSKKTVEINNTDAEGRLILADGVSYAARTLKAQVVLDAATLTGAQMIATGMLHAAIVSNDAALETLLVEAGRESGDLVHPLPFAPEFFRAEFKSPVADMRNSVKNRSNAQSSCAAQFIYNHLEDTAVRWGHVDLAGPAFRGDRGTGFGVALLAETVRRLIARG